MVFPTVFSQHPCGEETSPTKILQPDPFLFISLGNNLSGQVGQEKGTRRDQKRGRTEKTRELEQKEGEGEEKEKESRERSWPRLGLTRLREEPNQLEGLLMSQKKPFMCHNPLLGEK